MPKKMDEYILTTTQPIGSHWAFAWHLPEGGVVVRVEQGEGAQAAGVELVQPVALQAEQPQAGQLQQRTRVEVPEEVVVQVQAQQGGQAEESG